MAEETTLKDEVKALNQKLDSLVNEGKAKKFNLPWKAKLGNSQANKGYTIMQFINENKSIEFFKVPIDEMTTLVKECPRLATPEYILTYKNKPWIIQGAWSTEPFSPTMNYEQAVRDKMLAAGYRLLANRQELGEVKTKGKMSGALIFGIIVAVIVGGYLLLKR